MNQIPTIRIITDCETLQAVCALAQSAESYRKAILMLLNGTSADYIIKSHGEYLELAGQVINNWCEQLAIDV